MGRGLETRNRAVDEGSFFVAGILLLVLLSSFVAVLTLIFWLYVNVRQKERNREKVVRRSNVHLPTCRISI